MRIKRMFELEIMMMLERGDWVEAERIRKYAYTIFRKERNNGR